MRVLMLSKALMVALYRAKLDALVRHAAPGGLDLLTVVPARWGTQSYEDGPAPDGWRVWQAPVWLGGHFHLHVYPTLADALHSARPHLLHIDEEPYNAATWHALALARRASIPALAFTWQNLHRRYPPPFSWGERWALRHLDALIAGTHQAADVWRAKGYTGPLRVIPQFGSDPALFTPAPPGARAGRSFTVGYAGRLVPEKGVQVLLDALGLLPADVHATIVGDGPHADVLRAQAAQRGLGARVMWAGAVPSRAMPGVMRGFDVLALPSLSRPNWTEQFGRVLVEAMLSGVPVVASASGAIPEVVADAGVLVPEGDATALAAALRALYDDPARAADLAARGRAHAAQHHTHDAVAHATLALYQDVLAR